MLTEIYKVKIGLSLPPLWARRGVTVNRGNIRTRRGVTVNRGNIRTRRGVTVNRGNIRTSKFGFETTSTIEGILWNMKLKAFKKKNCSTFSKVNYLQNCIGYYTFCYYHCKLFGLN